MSTNLTFKRLDQTHGPFRLGRHQLHDPRSRAYDAAEITRSRPLTNTAHKRFGPVFDQGQIGSCTANAALGLLMTQPFWNGKAAYTEPDTQQLYREETRLDDTQIPGHWEPDDTGSTGLWSMKALKARGLIHSYRHAFSFTTVLHLLLDFPVTVGVPWYDSMFKPDSGGNITISPGAQLAGGHQVEVTALDVDRERVKIPNSWGTGWGLDGYCWLPWTDLDRLLDEGGDCTVPVI